jgi:hypothetical protein
MTSHAPSSSQPSTDAADPQVAATVQLLHHRHGWSRAAGISLVAFALGVGSDSSADSQGTPPPAWFVDIVIALGALTAISLIAMAVYSGRLRRTPPAIRAQAAPIAARHPHGPHTHHYPPRHLVTWSLGWIGMLLILLVAVVSAPAVVDGTAYLAGAEKTATFDPLSYQTSCNHFSANYSCFTSTDGILKTGGAETSATWQNVVPLGKPFQVRDPLWRWGLGLSLIDNDRIAVVAVLVSLLIEAAAVLVVIQAIRLSRNWRRHRRRTPTTTATP